MHHELPAMCLGSSEEEHTARPARCWCWAPTCAAPKPLLHCAVISINSLNFTSGCWSWWDDCYDVRDLMKDFLKENG